METKELAPTKHGKNQALLVPEILEAILLQLPLRDLLINAQRVSQAWHSAIKTSTRLQAVLFFQAEPRTLQEMRFNPLLQEAFPPWFNKPADLYSRGRVFTALDWNRSKTRRAAFMRKQASWRRMLPTQPPPRIFEVVRRSSYQVGARVCTGEVEFSEGVCMGTLYDYAYVSVAKPISSFTVEWHVPLASRSEETEDVRHVDEERKDVVTMAVRYTFQCRRGMPPDVGEEFRSAAFEELDVPFGDEVVPTGE